VGGVSTFLRNTCYTKAFFANGSCIEPWQPGTHGLCLMTYQYSTPKNLSDPYLADWHKPKTFVRPTQGVQPHSYVFEDPSAAWEDPTTPGRWVFIGQTNNNKGVILEGWASNNGSDFDSGFSSIGNFFPGTNDARCGVPGGQVTGCGYFTPSFANGMQIKGYNLLWGGDNQYWLGEYVHNASTDAKNGTGQHFVPATLPQPFDGPESSCAKGFYHAESGRYLLWFWVSPADDGIFNAPVYGWDSMISIPRVHVFSRARSFTHAT
jgi:hypothetical protein